MKSVIRAFKLKTFTRYESFIFILLMHSERFELKTIFSYDPFLVKHREQITLQMWEMGNELAL